MNYKLFQAINKNAGHHPFLDGLMVFFTQFAFPIFALVLLLMWFLGKEKERMWTPNNFCDHSPVFGSVPKPKHIQP